MKKTSDIENFSTNLKFLCSLCESISDVCRQLSINRQQFNRYLNGSSFPSYKNLKKICDFFGVENEEIIEDSISFQKKVTPLQTDSNSSAIPPELAKVILPLLNQSDDRMERYLGYYYRYFYSVGFPGYIFKSFIKIYERNNIYYVKHIERTNNKDLALIKRQTVKYHGLAFFLSERLFIVESDPTLNSTISETILSPNYRPNNPYLSGMMIFASSCSTHQPSAARTVFEHLGKSIDIRSAMKKCGLFHHEDGSIPEDIKQLINNNIASEEFTLSPAKC